MSNTVSIGISFPKKIYEKIDILRGDIPRSKYILRILEQSSLIKNENNLNRITKMSDSLDSGLNAQVSSESRGDQ